MPDPATAKTEIDWGKLLEDFGPPTRTVLEFGRLVPGWGLLAGLGADAINFASDLAAIPNSQNAELTTNLVMFRNGVNIVNNGVGHVLYVNQLITDGLAGSVVGVEFAPLSMAANEFVSGAKVALDGVVMATDVFVEVEALYRADHAPTSDEAEKWRLLADGYQANQLGDVVNIVLDVMSLASAGAAQTGIINEVRLPLTAGGAFLKNAGPNIIGALNNIIGVWLGGLVTAGRHDPLVRGHAATVTLAKDAVVLHLAGGFVDAEAVKARAAYDGIDAIIDVFAEYADQQIADLDAVVASIGDGRSTFEVIRDAVQSGIDDMTAKIALLQRLTAGATDARMNADVITATCAGLLAQLDGITVPPYTLPEVELGDGMLADAAEGVANIAGGVANATLRLTIGSIEVAVDVAKDAVRGPIEQIRSQAVGLGEWVAILAQQSDAMAEVVRGHLASFSAGLARCEGAEDVLDLIIGQVSDIAGTPRFTVEDMRQTWHGVAEHIDAYAELGARLHRRADLLLQQAAALHDGRDPSMVAAAADEPPPDEGAGPGS
ncbi:MAG: hypothetical protein ACKO91_12855 [Acidimicrobiales bacterium]